MRRLTATLVTTVLALLVLVPAALAAPDGGQGTYGEADDKVVTNAGFIVIAILLKRGAARPGRERDAHTAGPA